MKSSDHPSDPIKEAVEAIERLHVEHRAGATPLQKLIEKITSSAANPRFIAWLTVLIAIWMGANLLLGHRAWDEPPFAWLQGITGLAALYMTILIVSTQRHDDELAAYRERLMLELVILSEQKTAKVIELLEELRRDDPHIHDRLDQEADALSVPAEPQAVLDAIRGGV